MTDDNWIIEFTGTPANVREVRKRVGRMENTDGDVSTSLLHKPRGESYRVWVEAETCWVPIVPGQDIICEGWRLVPKYGFVPNLRVVGDGTAHLQ